MAGRNVGTSDVRHLLMCPALPSWELRQCLLPEARRSWTPSVAQSLGRQVSRAVPAAEGRGFGYATCPVPSKQETTPWACLHPKRPHTSKLFFDGALLEFAGCKDFWVLGNDDAGGFR